MAISEALNFTHELDAKTKMSDDIWRLRVDQNLQFYTREYILEENITKYNYQLKRGLDGLPNRVVSLGFEEEGDILGSFKKGVGKRANAEVIGFEKIEQKVFQEGIEGNFFVWVSLPGRAEDGFGDHSFTFIGQILEDHIEMAAFKNWLSIEENANRLNKFVQDEEQFTAKSSDLDFLKAPVFLPGGKRFKTHLDVIHYLDPKRSDLQEGDNLWFLDKLQPFRRAVILALETSDLQGAERAKKAHDNYALALLKRKDGEVEELEYWSKQPAVVLRGSCGFSGSVSKKGGFSTWFGIESSYFDCPRCKGKIESGKGITTCPHCGARKEDYKSCD